VRLEKVMNKISNRTRLSISELSQVRILVIGAAVATVDKREFATRVDSLKLGPPVIEMVPSGRAV